MQVGDFHTGKLACLPLGSSLFVTGFTLLELIVVVSIVAILLAIAIPSFNEAVRNNRLTSYANDFVTAMNLARSEAVKRGKPVTVRKVDNLSFTNLGAAANWENGWDVFVDATPKGAPNGQYDAGDTLIKTYPALESRYTLRGNPGFPAFIRFTEDGESNAAGIFMLCDDRDNNATAEADTSRLLMVNAMGRVSMGADTNTPKDGIPNINAATNSTDCTP